MAIENAFICFHEINKGSKCSAVISPRLRPIWASEHKTTISSRVEKLLGNKRFSFKLQWVNTFEKTKSYHWGLVLFKKPQSAGFRYVPTYLSGTLLPCWGSSPKQVYIGVFSSLGKLLHVLFGDASSYLETGWQRLAALMLQVPWLMRGKAGEMCVWCDRDTYYPLPILQGKMQEHNSVCLNDLCLMSGVNYNHVWSISMSVMSRMTVRLDVKGHFFVWLLFLLLFLKLSSSLPFYTEGSTPFLKKILSGFQAVTLKIKTNNKLIHKLQ